MLTSRHTSEHQKHPYQGQLGHGLAEFEFSQTIINDYLKAYKKKKKLSFKEVHYKERKHPRRDKLMNVAFRERVFNF